MKFLKSVLVVLVVLATLMLAQPSWADKRSFLKNPDYIEVTKALDSLLTLKETQAETEGYKPEEVQQKIDELEFQKYALQTGINWGQCRNETGKTLAVYGPKPDFDDEDYNYQYPNALYFLADGQTTKNKWDCEGVYLPNDAKIAGIGSNEQGQEVAGPIAVKIGDGTQLVVKTNPQSAAVEFSIPPSQVFKTGEGNWFIPNVSQSVIDTRVANAPAAKVAKGSPLVVMKNPQEMVEAEVSPQTQPPSPPELIAPPADLINKP